MRSTKGRQLHRIRSIAITHPEFRAPRTPRLESDGFSIGRDSPTTVATAGGDEFNWHARSFPFSRQLELPDATGMPHLCIGESIGGTCHSNRFHILREEKRVRFSAAEGNAPQMAVRGV